MSISSAIETINPEKAAEYLGKIYNQRSFKKTHGQNLARIMKDGHWHMAGDPIRFDTNGHLIDGQHRLQAVIDSGTTQQFLILRGLDPASYTVMDQGRPRTRGDTLVTMDIKNSNIVGAAIAVLLRMKLGLEIDRHPVDNSEVAEFASKNRQELDRAITSARQFRSLSGATYGAFLFLAYHANPEKAEAFAEALANGSNLDSTNPALVLRNHAIRVAQTKNKIEDNRPSNLLPILVHAFNKFCRNETMARVAKPKIEVKDRNFYPGSINANVFWKDK